MRLIDLTGQRFGRWLVLCRAPGKGNDAYWMCQCDCGTKLAVNSGCLRNGSSQSCGCLRSEIRQSAYPELAGERFGSWTVLGWGKTREYRLCRCDCGTVKETRRYYLVNGKSTNCGCEALLKRVASKTIHGDTVNGSTKEFTAWFGLKDRCKRPKNKDWEYYGGRGIKVCDRWDKSFAAFLEDMGRAPSPKHSIDRIDVNGNYEPGNCRWATWKMQAGNRRKRKSASK